MKKPDMAEGGTAEQRAHQRLVPLQRVQSGKWPLFCLPGAGADVFCFKPLAGQVGHDWNVYGLRYPELDGNVSLQIHVETIARSNNAVIGRVCVDQPMHLVGHAFGAWLAFEMALQWIATGRQVGSLVLLDADPPRPATDLDDPVTSLLRLVRILEEASGRRLYLYRHNLQKLDDRARCQSLHRRMIAQQLAAARLPLAAVEEMVHAFAACGSSGYTPAGIFPGPLLLVRARNAGRTGKATLDVGADKVELWRNLAPLLSLAEAPGNRTSMLAPRHAKRLGRILLEHWRDGRDEPGAAASM